MPASHAVLTSRSQVSTHNERKQQIHCLLRAVGGGKVNAFECIAHVFNYCERVKKDIEFADKGGAIRYAKGVAPQRKPRNTRPASIKPGKGKKRRRSTSASGNERPRKKDRGRRVHFNDGRAPDRLSDFESDSDRSVHARR